MNGELWNFEVCENVNYHIDTAWRTYCNNAERAPTKLYLGMDEYAKLKAYAEKYLIGYPDIYNKERERLQIS